MATTAKNPYVIRAPRLAFLNLAGAAAHPLLNEDRAALTQHFTGCAVSEKAVPLCDVLMLYCRVEPTGRITASDLTLREIIRDSRAVVVIVASENAPESYIAAAQQTSYGSANLVMTLRRNGSAFPHFFRQLFARMAEGVTMPLAWVQLAPQIPGVSHDNAPETIFACEAGHIAFAPAP